MNNKTFNDMANKTVFVGRVNGETFDNVAAYNARLKELVDAGVTVEASSETKIVAEPSNKNNVSCTCDVKNLPYNECDEDLTIYPYMCEDDPFYLDLLVTTDPVTNQEAYTETQKVLQKCYDYTLDLVKGWCPCEREAFVNDLDEILDNINADIKDTMNAIDKVAAKHKRLEESYRKELDKLNQELDLLEAADRVSGMFKNYYSDVRDRVEGMNIEDECSCCDKSCDDAVVETTVTEKAPQTEFDFNKLLEQIFGPGIIRSRR